MSEPKRKLLEPLLDSVLGAGGMLYDWLGRDPNEPKAPKPNGEKAVIKRPDDAIDTDGEER